MRLTFAYVCAVGLAVSACKDVHYAHVTVTTAPGTPEVDTVALYIGLADTPCTNHAGSPCTQLYPQEPGSSPPAAEAAPVPITQGLHQGGYFRDTTNDLSIVQLSGSETSASFELDGDRDEKKTVELVAVGFANGAPVQTAATYDLALLYNSPVVVDMALAPIVALASSSIEAESTRPSGEYLNVWNGAALTPPSDTDCVLYEHSDASGTTRTFLAPNDDPDCDRHKWFLPDGTTHDPRECMDLWFDFQGASTISDDQASCAQTFTSAQNTHGSRSPTLYNACLVGGNPCVDGLGPDTTQCPATVTSTCVPSAACAISSGAGCEKDLSACSSQVAMRCTVTTQGDGTACNGATPPGAMDLSPLIPAQSLTTCTAIASSQNLSLVPGPLVMNEIDLGPAAFTLAPVTNVGNQYACAFTLGYNGMPVQIPLTTAAPQYQLLHLALSNHNQMIVPLALTFATCEGDTSTTPIISCVSGTSTTGLPAGAYYDSITYCAL
ncbi:MAG TPA: hypothetical protein VMJ10_36860 [Kofleriaceae bacterium]|nr:hypothetical protein [Kofleriaceae bacterium]